MGRCGHRRGFLDGFFGVLFSEVFTPHEGLELTKKMDWKQTEWSPECPCWSLVNI